MILKMLFRFLGTHPTILNKFKYSTPEKPSINALERRNYSRNQTLDQNHSHAHEAISCSLLMIMVPVSSLRNDRIRVDVPGPPSPISVILSGPHYGKSVSSVLTAEEAMISMETNEIMRSLVAIRVCFVSLLLWRGT